MSHDSKFDTNGNAMRRLKEHCVVRVFLHEETDIYAVPLEFGQQACIGIKNVELFGSLDRIEEVASALALLVKRLRSEPGMLDHWRAGGRVGHPNLITLESVDPATDVG